jgi:hypothetical protein
MSAAGRVGRRLGSVRRVPSRQEITHLIESLPWPERHARGQGLGALRDEARSARLAAGAAGAGSHPMTGLHAQSSEAERGWQAAAVAKPRGITAGRSPRPSSPDIPDY